MGSLPAPRYYSSGFWVESQGAAYIFPSHVPAFPAYTRIVKYNWARNEMDMLETSFPFMWYGTAAVWSGRYGYVIPGLRADVPVGSIFQFDPETEQGQWIEVGGDPSWSPEERSGTAAVYVQKLNRIYAFGSFKSGGGFKSKIFYIELDLIDSP